MKKVKSNIVAKNKEHLSEIIRNFTDENGLECSLNHIDVSTHYRYE